jgi:alpha,alpha-trehalose phosphorylase
LQHNTRDGIHIAAVAGTWIALVNGFGGMRLTREELCFSPRLPSALERLSFKLRYRGRRLQVTATHHLATYTLLDGPAVHISHHGEPFTLTAAEPVSRPIPVVPDRPRPTQPPGREPIARSQRQ